ncbi:MAG: hypothetical protein ABI744_08200 [Chloroflexota bacterium]
MIPRRAPSAYCADLEVLATLTIFAGLAVALWPRRRTRDSLAHET